MAKQLYTEADVRALAPGGRLVLGGGAIATPAALDLAHQRGIRIVYGGPREAGVADAQDDRGRELWARMVDADGQYVVTVTAGRAVVSRLTPDGPVEVGRT